MNPKELNNIRLIKAYKNATDIVEVAELRRELWDRGFDINPDDNTIYFPECNKVRKRICALCTESPWCLDYESGGLGKNTSISGLGKGISK